MRYRNHCCQCKSISTERGAQRNQSMVAQTSDRPTASHNIMFSEIGPNSEALNRRRKKGQHFSAQQHAYCLARFTCYRQSVSARARVDHSTRSQAVARIADRTASQHLWESRDVIGHVTI